MEHRAHALVFPFPAQGHINPLMQLSQHLSTSHGFLITFVNSEHNHARIMHARSAANPIPPPPSTSPNINMVALCDGLPVDDHRRTSDLKRLVQSIEVHMLPLLEQLILDIQGSPDSPSLCCIIADAFTPWVHGIAERTGIDCVIGFFPSSVAQFSLLYHIPLLLANGFMQSEENIRLPGLLDIPARDLTWNIGSAIDNERIFDFLHRSAKQLKKFSAILVNSYDELEKEAMDAILRNDDMKVLPVGPLVLQESFEASYNIAQTGLWEQDQECLKWLEGKAASSVIYIAFGSSAIFSVEELHEIALGLESSGYGVLWVLRPDLMNGTPANLPEGFVERTKDRFCFTSWAPQPLVLSHSSVGAFLTHCGWNSTMESISMGVPMLTCPYLGDQRGNCQSILHQWKIGMPLSGTNSRKVIDRQEVERVVRSMMGSKEGVEVQKRVKMLQKKAIDSLEKDKGASYNNLKECIGIMTKQWRLKSCEACMETCSKEKLL